MAVLRDVEGLLGRGEELEDVGGWRSVDDRGGD